MFGKQCQRAASLRINDSTWITENTQKYKARKFPSGPVVKTLCFPLQGAEGLFDPCSDELKSHMPQGVAQTFLK